MIAKLGRVDPSSSAPWIFPFNPPAAKRNSSASARHTFRAPDDHHGRDRSRMDARHRQGRAQRRQRADHGQHRPGTRTRPRRPTRRSRRFCRTLRQIRSPSRPIFPRATDRARVASHRLTPIASRDLHSQAGPPPEKTITLASLIAPRMVRPASRPGAFRLPNPRHFFVRGSPNSFFPFSVSAFLFFRRQTRRERKSLLRRDRLSRRAKRNVSSRG